VIVQYTYNTAHGNQGTSKVVNSEINPVATFNKIKIILLIWLMPSNMVFEYSCLCLFRKYGGMNPEYYMESPTAVILSFSLNDDDDSWYRSSVP
jgi:hypothetical protein